MSASKDENTGLTPSVAKLKKLIGTSPAPRMLTPYEIELLRRSKQEIDQFVGEIFGRKDDSKEEGC